LLTIFFETNLTKTSDAENLRVLFLASGVAELKGKPNIQCQSLGS
jgi:hypothetical protein